MPDFDGSGLSNDLQLTGAWAAALLHAIARDEIADRRTQRLTEPKLDTYSRFRGRLSSADLVALLFEDAAVLHRVPFDPAAVGGPLRLDRLPDLQRREDAGEAVNAGSPPAEFSQGRRGTDFLRAEYWALRGRLDVPKESFIPFTEVPGRSGVETLYGWAGWTAQQRVKALLAIDEELEDASVPLADRIGLLDSAWRLLPDVAREDAAAANLLKAELQALVGPEGPSRELIEDWKKQFPLPTSRATGTKKGASRATAARADEDDDVNGETE